MQHVSPDALHNTDEHTLITIYNLFSNSDNSNNIMLSDSLYGKAELSI